MLLEKVWKRFNFEVYSKSSMGRKEISEYSKHGACICTRQAVSTNKLLMGHRIIWLSHLFANGEDD